MYVYVTCMYVLFLYIYIYVYEYICEIALHIDIIEVRFDQILKHNSSHGIRYSN